MKYIKQYESIESIKDIKKYFIAPYFNVLAIFEFIMTERVSEIKTLYIYDKDKNGIRKFVGEGGFRKSVNIIQSKALFMSDDLQECIDIIPTLIDTNKFNL